MISYQTKRVIKRLGLASLLIIGVPAGGALSWAAYLRLSGNIHQVGESPVYRSAQLSVSNFENVVQEHAIKSVLNLRGPQQNAPWYDAERASAERLQIIYIDLPLSANEEPDEPTLDHLIATMRDAPKPLLIHCEGGEIGRAHV